MNDGSISAISVLAGAGILLRRRDEWRAPCLLITDSIGGALACLNLWVRRRWPFGVAMFTIALTAYSETAGIASAFGLITVAIRGSIRHSVIVTVLADPTCRSPSTPTSVLTIGI